MHLLIRSALVMGLFAVVLAGIPAAAVAQDATEDRLSALEEKLRQQDQEILRLKEQLREQGQATDTVGRELDSYFAKVEDSSDWMKPDTFRVFWKNGLNMATSDGAFKLKIGGRFMNDWSWLDADTDLERMYPGRLEGESLRYTEFRQARLFVSGTIHELLSFKVQYDFAGGDSDFKDVYLQLNKLPLVGHFRVGHARVLMGLETLTSSKYITFMERAGTTALLPDRQNGFYLFNTVLDQRLYWGTGYYTPATDGYGAGVINNGFFARVAGTPWFDKSDEQTNLLHLGASAAYEDSGKEGEFTVSNRPPNHSSPIRPIQIDVMAESRWIYQFEGAVVYGPFSLQGEFVQQNYDSSASGDPSFNAFYIYGSWFITGEQRAYDQKYAAFGRVKPRHNFWDGDGGTGALELAVRYSGIDADDKSVHGGEVNSWTVGLNWYLNPNVRIMFNYFTSEIKRTEDISGISPTASSVYGTVTEKGRLTGFMMRFQIDF